MQTSQTGCQLYSNTSPYKVSECSLNEPYGSFRSAKCACTNTVSNWLHFTLKLDYPNAFYAPHLNHPLSWKGKIVR